MRHLGELLCIVVLLGLPNCATNLSERASRIRIISPDEAKQYDYVGLIQGSFSLSGLA